jgi:hypothetical protein
MSEEEFGTNDERDQIVQDIEKWAESHDADSSVEIAVVLQNSAITFTLHELARDMKEETALGVVLLDIIISESRKAGIAPIDYVKRMAKILRNVPGELIKKPPFQYEVN